MKILSKKNTAVLVLLFMVGLVAVLSIQYKPEKQEIQEKAKYWLLLLRKSNQEFLYKGIPGNQEKSTLVRRFQVKSGIPNERPTPLPQKVGRHYWLITKKEETTNPETAPFFLTLNVPGTEIEPYGPVPYIECAGKQCNWVLPGAFGLHGVNGDTTRLGGENAGSSGCIRHTDEDITYLYNLLDPEKEPIRYYIQDI